MNTQLQKLPIGIQGFESLRKDGYLYVDKTRRIYELTHGRKAKSIFRYGLDIVAEFLTKGKNDCGIPIFGILSTENPIFTPI